MGRVVLDASAQARRRGDRRVSTEHLVLALLAGADRTATDVLAIGLDAAHEALDELLARRPPDPAAVLLDALRVHRAQARGRLGVT